MTVYGVGDANTANWAGGKWSAPAKYALLAAPSGWSCVNNGFASADGSSWAQATAPDGSGSVSETLSLLSAGFGPDQLCSYLTAAGNPTAGQEAAKHGAHYGDPTGCTLDPTGGLVSKVLHPLGQPSDMYLLVSERKTSDTPGAQHLEAAVFSSKYDRNPNGAAAVGCDLPASKAAQCVTTMQMFVASQLVNAYGEDQQQASVAAKAIASVVSAPDSSPSAPETPAECHGKVTGSLGLDSENGKVFKIPNNSVKLPGGIEASLKTEFEAFGFEVCATGAAKLAAKSGFGNNVLFLGVTPAGHKQPERYSAAQQKWLVTSDVPKMQDLNTVFVKAEPKLDAGVNAGVSCKSGTGCEAGVKASASATLEFSSKLLEVKLQDHGADVLTAEAQPKLAITTELSKDLFKKEVEKDLARGESRDTAIRHAEQRIVDSEATAVKEQALEEYGVDASDATLELEAGMEADFDAVFASDAALDAAVTAAAEEAAAGAATDVVTGEIAAGAAEEIAGLAITEDLLDILLVIIFL